MSVRYRIYRSCWPPIYPNVQAWSDFSSNNSTILQMAGKLRTVQLLLLLATFVAVISAQLADDSGNVAEVRQLLNDIKIASIKKHGVFSDFDPTLSRARQRIQPPQFDDGTEHSVNRPVADDLFENDIVLTVPQARAILDEVVRDAAPTRGRNPVKRQAAPAASSHWPQPNAIPFIFQYSDKNWQQLIRQAQNHIASETCARFYEVNNTALPRDYVQFIRGSGCWSNVGRTGGRQQISIGYGCDAMGIIAHEMLHALGLWHEQSRTDRDAFIVVYYDYIYPGTQSNFEKRTTRNSDNMGQPYDLGSVMHYGSRAFSTSADKYSVVTRDATYQQTIGQRARISFKDAKMINLRYCTKICPRDLDCKNSGYTDPNNCDVCKCPDGYGGTLCDQVPQSNLLSCRGGEYIASNHLNLIRSPYVTAGARCFYRIRAGDNQKIELTFTQVNFPCTDVCTSYVEVKYKGDKTASGARLCCKLPSTSIISDGPEVLLIFYGANDDTLQQNYKGFQLTFKAVDRGVRMTTAPVENVATSTSPPTTTPESVIDGTGEWSDWAAWSGCTVSCGGCGSRRRVRACYGGNLRCSGLAYETGTCGQNACPIPNTTTRCQGRLLMPCDFLTKLDFGTVLSGSTLFNDPSRSSNSLTNTAAPENAKEKKPDMENYARRYRRHSNQTSENNEIVPFIEFGPELENGNHLEDGTELQHLLDTDKNAKILRELGLQPQGNEFDPLLVSSNKRSRRFVDASKQSDTRVYCEKRFSYNCPTYMLTISMDWMSNKGTQSEDGRRCCPGYYTSGNACVKSR